MGLSLFGLPFLLNWAFQGRGEMLCFTFPQVLRQFVFLICVMVAINEPEQLMRLPLAEVAAVAAAAACYVALYHCHGFRLRMRLRHPIDRDLVRQALPISGSQIIWALRMYLPVLLLLFLAGNEKTGLFGVSHRVVMVFQALLGVYFTNLFPIISQASAVSVRELYRLITRSSLLVSIVTSLLGVGVLFLAPWLIELVYGASFVDPDSVWTLVILVWIIPILGLRRHATYSLIAFDLQRIEFWWSLFGAVLLVLLLGPLASEWGPIGAACAMVVSELFATVGVWIHFLACLHKQLLVPSPIPNHSA
jgi:PST family polysaccharide transporter